MGVREPRTVCVCVYVCMCVCVRVYVCVGAGRLILQLHQSSVDRMPALEGRSPEEAGGPEAFATTQEGAVPQQPSPVDEVENTQMAFMDLSDFKDDALEQNAREERAAATTDQAQWAAYEARRLEEVEKDAVDDRARAQTKSKCRREKLEKEKLEEYKAAKFANVSNSAQEQSMLSHPPTLAGGPKPAPGHTLCSVSRCKVKGYAEPAVTSEDGESDGGEAHSSEHCNARPADARAKQCTKGCVACCSCSVRMCRCMCECSQRPKTVKRNRKPPNVDMRVQQVRGTDEAVPAFNVDHALHRFFVEVYGRVPSYRELSAYWPSQDVTDSYGSVIARFEMVRTYHCMPCGEAGMTGSSMPATELQPHRVGRRHERKMREAREWEMVYFDGHVVRGAPGYYGPEFPADGDAEFSSAAEEGGHMAELDVEELFERAREVYGRAHFDSLPLVIQEDMVMKILYGECPFKGHAVRNDWSCDDPYGDCGPCDCDGAQEDPHCTNTCDDGSEAMA